MISYARAFEIDLLTVAYNSIGVLKYHDFRSSGETYLIERYLTNKIRSPKPVMIDVGANKGDYSLALSAEFPTGKIIAFEPNPNAFKSLLAKLDGKNIECVPCGLSSKNGTQLLWVYPDDLGTEHASQSEEIFTSFFNCPEPSNVEIELTTLDYYCESNDISVIDFLKIDTEGHEFDVLIGATSMLEKNAIDVIQFEFGECDVYSRVFMKDFYKLLGNYDFFRLNTNEMVPLNEYTPAHEIFRFQNIIAVSRG
ncbi:FkbM family methyltransferase [soil metagenome]